MYSITYKTKKGGSGVMSTSSYQELEKRVKYLFSQHLPATIYEDGAIIGRVWKDDSQQLKWNYSIEHKQFERP